MINFYKNFLSGPVYIIVVIISLILIMAIIGYVMEKKQLQKKKNDETVTIEDGAIKEDNIENNEANIIQDEMVDSSAATSAAFPSVMDFNEIEEKQEEAEPIKEAVNFEENVQTADIPSTIDVNTDKM